MIQATIALLVIIGLGSVVVIGLVVADLYDHQQQTDHTLCVVVQAEWAQIRKLGAHQGVHIPRNPPPCPKPY